MAKWHTDRLDLRTPIQSRPKQHRNDSTSHPKLCWMSLDELERPIGQHRKRDEETSKQHPKPVWMSIGVAVTMGSRRATTIVTAGRIPIRPHPKSIRIQNSDGWAFLTSVSAPRFPMQRVTGMGFLDRGQSKVIALLCSTAVSFRPSSRPRKNHAISLGQHHFYSCAGPLLTIGPVLLPFGPPPQRRLRHEVDPCFSAIQLPYLSVLDIQVLQIVSTPSTSRPDRRSSCSRRRTATENDLASKIAMSR